MTRALFLGRFQPFHKGHDAAVSFIETHPVEQLIIGVGSSQYSGTERNPFTFSERYAYISGAMAAHDVAHTIVAVPDIHDEVRWANYVIETVGPIDVVFTGNPNTKLLFEQAGYPVTDIPLLPHITGTQIRSYMNDGNTAWHDMVPKHILPLIHSL